MNDKTTVALGVVIITGMAIIVGTPAAIDVAKLAIAGLLGMATGQNWK